MHSRGYEAIAARGQNAPGNAGVFAHARRGITALHTYAISQSQPLRPCRIRSLAAHGFRISPCIPDKVRVLATGWVTAGVEVPAPYRRGRPARLSHSGCPPARRNDASARYTPPDGQRAFGRHRAARLFPGAYRTAPVRTLMNSARIPGFSRGAHASPRGSA